MVFWLPASLFQLGLTDLTPNHGLSPPTSSFKDTKFSRHQICAMGNSPWPPGVKQMIQMDRILFLEMVFGLK
jgi:hypothetical protein